MSEADDFEDPTAVATFENPIVDADAVTPRSDDGGRDPTGEPSSPKKTNMASDLHNFGMFAEAPLPEWRLQFKEIDDNQIKGAVSALCTMLALFLPDVKELSLPQEYDTAVDGVMTFVMLFFIVEICVQLCAIRGYWTTLFFWLDVAATISLIPEVPLVAGLMSSNHPCTAALAMGGDMDGTIVRAGRAARAGARAGRLQGLVRVVRVFRILQISRLPEKTGMKSVKPESLVEKQESKDVVPEVLSAKISYALARITIIVVIASIVTTSLFMYTPDSYWQQTSIEGILMTYQQSHKARDGLACSELFNRDTAAGYNTSNACLYDIHSIPHEELKHLKDWSKGYPYLDGVENGDGANLLHLRLTIDFAYVDPDPTSPTYGEHTKRDMLIVDEQEIMSRLRDSEIVDVCGRGYAASYDGKFDAMQAAEGRIKLTLMIVLILVVSGFILSTEMNSFLSVPMQRLLKSQALSEALLMVFMDSADPIPTLEASCKKILNCEVVNIFFADPGTQEFWCMRTVNDESPYSGELRMKLGLGTVGACAKKGLPELIEYDTVAEVDKKDPSLRASVPKRGKRDGFDWSARSVMCYPLLFQVGKSTECVGVMQAINKLGESKPAVSFTDNFKNIMGFDTVVETGFEQFDLDMLAMFGDQVSQILKGFQMDAMYENLFKDDSDEAQVMQSLMTEYATADVVMAAKEKKTKGPDLKFMFDLYDVDKSGDLDKKELGQLAVEMGRPLSSEEIDAAMNEMDDDGGGTVCFPEFAAWWASSNSILKQHMARNHAAPPSIDRLLTGLKLPTLSELRVWGFPCLDYNIEQLCGMSLMMMTDPELDICEDFSVSPDTIMKFTTELLGNSYNSVPYHNFYHAFSVLQGSYWLVTSTETCASFTALEKLSMLIAGMGHDAGHDGVNTAFHVESKSELAHCYNDKSPLENMHARDTFAAMQKKDCGILDTLDGPDFKRARQLIVDSIIGTDMAYHKKHVDELSAKHDLNMEDKAERDMVMALLVHLVDVGAMSYSWDQAPRWSRMVMTEFQAQVNQETSEGMVVSGFMDLGEDKSAFLGKFAGSQVGFIGFVLMPFFALFPPHMPELTEAYDQLKANKDNWKKIKVGDLDLAPGQEADDEKMKWSVNVGMGALGPAKTGPTTATAMTKLGSGKVDGWA